MLKVDLPDAIEPDLGEATDGVSPGNLIDAVAQLPRERDGQPGRGVVSAEHPQHARTLVERHAPTLACLLPESERSIHEIDVDPVRSVEAADDAGLAPGTGA